MKYTKGPWKVERSELELCVLNKFNCEVCEIWRDDADPTQNFEAKANANLIAAAPDMLELIIELYGDVYLYENNRLHTKIERLLAKMGVEP
jgi:hypothetical protein